MQKANMTLFLWAGSEVWLHTLLIATLSGDECLSSCPGLFTLRKVPQYTLNRRVGGLTYWGAGKDADTPFHLVCRPVLILPTKQTALR